MGKQSVQFEYRLVGTGWSHARLSVGGSEVELSASYLSDALGDLLTGALLIAEGETPVSFSWDEEPGEYRWILSLTPPDGLRITVLWFDQLWGGRPDAEGKPVIQSDCGLDEFLRAVARAARSLAEEWGLDGYRQKWVDHDFPIVELERLERSRS